MMQRARAVPEKPSRDVGRRHDGVERGGRHAPLGETFGKHRARMGRVGDQNDNPPGLAKASERLDRRGEHARLVMEGAEYITEHDVVAFREGPQAGGP